MGINKFERSNVFEQEQNFMMDDWEKQGSFEGERKKSRLEQGKNEVGKISDPEIKEDKISPVGLSQNPSGEKEERQLWDGCQSQQTDT